jgi:hypothetical protein
MFSKLPSAIQSALAALAAPSSIEIRGDLESQQAPYRNE